MQQAVEQREWWALHLRKARGETLSAEEEQFYQSEAARQDREAPSLKTDLAVLNEICEQVVTLTRENQELRHRVFDNQ